MPLGILTGLARAMRRKRTSSLDILSSKRAPRNYYKGKNCKPTGFHTRKGGYVLVQEKLPNYVVPELTDLKLKPYVSQCPINVDTTEANVAAKGQFLIAASAMSADSRGSRPARVFKDSRQRRRCYGTIGIVLRSSLTKLGFVVHMGVAGGRAAAGLLLISHILPC